MLYVLYEGRVVILEGITTLNLHYLYGTIFHDFLQTFRWPEVPKDSSDFDDFWTELIVMT